MVRSSLHVPPTFYDIHGYTYSLLNPYLHPEYQVATGSRDLGKGDCEGERSYAGSSDLGAESIAVEWVVLRHTTIPVIHPHRIENPKKLNSAHLHPSIHTFLSADDITASHARALPDPIVYPVHLNSKW